MGVSSGSDIELMQRIAAQDQQAFRAVYQLYGKAIYSLAYRVLQNATLAEEVTQDTFLKVWDGRAVWNPDKGLLKSWLLSITQFTAIDRLRREHRQPTVHPIAIEELEVSDIENGWQDGVVLRTLITQLSEEQAALIDLAFFRGMSHNEIADATGIPLGTVKTRLRTGLQRLRELWLESLRHTSASPHASVKTS
jgi:RNA polymerase sigma-70 factor, ECF subfamily